MSDVNDIQMKTEGMAGAIPISALPSMTRRRCARIVATAPCLPPLDFIATSTPQMSRVAMPHYARAVTGSFRRLMHARFAAIRAIGGAFYERGGARSQRSRQAPREEMMRQRRRAKRRQVEANRRQRYARARWSTAPSFSRDKS